MSAKNIYLRLKCISQPRQSGVNWQLQNKEQDSLHCLTVKVLLYIAVHDRQYSYYY